MQQKITDPYASKNILELKRLAQRVSEIGLRYNPGVDAAVQKYSCTRVSETFCRLQALLKMCVDAPAILDQRLQIVMAFAAPHALAKAGRLQKQAKQAAMKLAEYHSDKHITNTGRAQHEIAEEALNHAIEHAIKHQQKHIAWELLPAVLGMFYHLTVAALEGLKAAVFLVLSRKRDPFERTFATLAEQIQWMQTFEDQLAEMCLFLYLIPEQADLSTGVSVSESTARNRLEAAL